MKAPPRFATAGAADAAGAAGGGPGAAAPVAGSAGGFSAGVPIGAQAVASPRPNSAPPKRTITRRRDSRSAFIESSRTTSLLSLPPHEQRSRRRARAELDYFYHGRS